MVFADEFLHIHGSPAHLLSIHVADQRLLAARIFLAHAASLRQTTFFASLTFRGFLHSFVLRVRVLSLFPLAVPHFLLSTWRLVWSWQPREALACPGRY